MSAHIIVSTDSTQWNVKVDLVKSPDMYAMAMAVRAATFLAEEDTITYADEFDGNDFFATHFLATVNGDPAGVIRLRWFPGYVLLERVAIRRCYRSYKVFMALGRAAFEHARQKGYTFAAGRARGDTFKLWRRFKAQPSGPEIHMYRGTLIPMVMTIDQKDPSTAMPSTGFGDPDFENLIVQVEGEWDFTKHQPSQAAEAA